MELHGSIFAKPDARVRMGCQPDALTIDSLRGGSVTIHRLPPHAVAAMVAAFDAAMEAGPPPAEPDPEDDGFTTVLPVVGSVS